LGRRNEVDKMVIKVRIVDVYNISGIGAVPVGVVTEGTFRMGMTLNINGKVMTVKTIEMNHRGVMEANVNDKIGFSLENGDVDSLNSVRGTEVQFEGEGIKVNQKKGQNPTKPKGFFGELFSRFKN